MAPRGLQPAWQFEVAPLIPNRSLPPDMTSPMPVAFSKALTYQAPPLRAKWSIMSSASCSLFRSLITFFSFQKKIGGMPRLIYQKLHLETTLFAILQNFP
jgi:hypothetical protein